MRFVGKIYKGDRFWLAEIPILDAMTQGRTPKEAFEMAVDMVQTMVNKQDFQVDAVMVSDDAFEVGSIDTRTLIALLLRRKRESSGLSLSQPVERLGTSSYNKAQPSDANRF